MGRHNRLIVAASIGLFLLHLPLNLVVALFKLVINCSQTIASRATVCLEENTITFTDKSSSLKLWKDLLVKSLVSELEILGDMGTFFRTKKASYGMPW